MSLVLLSLLGAAFAGDREDLEMVAEAVPLASPEMRGVLLAAGVTQIASANRWRVGSCGAALDAYAKASPETKTMLVANAFEKCPYMCPTGRGRKQTFEALALMAPLERSQHLVEACDASSEEPVFTGPWLDQRAQIEMVEYWVFRAAFAIVFDQLDGIEDSDALRGQYEAIRDELALTLVLGLPPLREDLELPVSSALRRPPFDPELVVIPRSGEIEKSAATGTLVLQSDASTPYRAVVAAMGERPALLAVYNDYDTRQAFIPVHPPIPRPERELEALDRPPLNLTVLVGDQGYVVVGVPGGGGPIPCKGPCAGKESYDNAALHEVLVSIKDEYPDEEAIVFAAEPEIRIDVVVAALDAARETQPPMERPEPLFPDVSLLNSGMQPSSGIGSPP